MIPRRFRSLFWDTRLEDLDPLKYPRYTIRRVLEHGDGAAVAWLLGVFPREGIRDVLRVDDRLSPRSATFWALYFDLPADEVPALRRR